MLCTTWKRRCLYGLKHKNPDFPSACHKPARGAFSKYCSDECGVKYMQIRIENWIDKGGDQESLWESVKNAPSREGVVVSAALAKQETVDEVKMEVDGDDKSRPVRRVPGSAVPGIVKPTKPKRERDLTRLRVQLDSVLGKRETLKKQMAIVEWREKLVDLAIRRSESLDGCGWDQRLCFDEEEVTEFGAGVLE